MNFFLLRFFVNAIKANKSITLRSNAMVQRNVGNRTTGKTGGTDNRGVPLVRTSCRKQAGKHIVE
jgi:hypothetical protein